MAAGAYSLLIRSCFAAIEPICGHLDGLTVINDSHISLSCGVVSTASAFRGAGLAQQKADLPSSSRFSSAILASNDNLVWKDMTVRQAKYVMLLTEIDFQNDGITSPDHNP